MTYSQGESQDLRVNQDPGSLYRIDMLAEIYYTTGVCSVAKRGRLLLRLLYLLSHGAVG